MERVQACCPGVEVELVDVAGPPVSPDLRGAGWAEVLAARAVLAPLRHRDRAGGRGRGRTSTVPGAGSARVELDLDDGVAGRVEVEVWAGEILCPVTLRSYALGAVHQALGMVWSEGIAVDAAGEPLDLTIRSFGILAARTCPRSTVRLHEDDGWPVNGSDAVFAATLAAAWMAEGLPGRWPTRRDAVRAPSRDVAAIGELERSTHESCRWSLLPRPPGRRLGHHLGPGRPGHRQQRGSRAGRGWHGGRAPSGAGERGRRARQRGGDAGRRGQDDGVPARHVRVRRRQRGLGRVLHREPADPLGRRRGGAARSGPGSKSKPGPTRRSSEPTGPSPAPPAGPVAPLRCATPGCQATWPKR